MPLVLDAYADISFVISKYTALIGGGTIDKYKVIQETECNGFKVVSYIEELPENERNKRDERLSKELLKILKEHNDQEEKP